MKTILASLLALGIAAPAYAGCTSYFNTTRCTDYNTGNTYRTTTDSFGNSRTQGHNYNTGSSWSQRTSGATGRTTGFDADGNMWSCDRRGNCY
jgi:hypothetical protein